MHFTLIDSTAQMLDKWLHTSQLAAHVYEYTFYTLAVIYLFIACVSLVQLVRLHVRTPDICFSTAKLFHFILLVLAIGTKT